MPQLAKRLKKPSASIAFVAFCLLAIVAVCVTYVVDTRSMRVLAMGAAVVVVVVLQYVVYEVLRRRGDPHAAVWSFCPTVLLLGLLYNFTFTPFTIPDEPYHYIAAYQLSDVLMLQGAGTPETLPMRVEDVNFVSSDALFPIALEKETLGNIVDYMGNHAVQPYMVDLVLHDHVLTDLNAPDFASNPFQDRLAPALGITFGRLLGLNGVLTFYMGRLFNLLLFWALAFLAVRITPVGKPIFMVVAMLPQSLEFAASYSYDSFIVSVSLVLSALLLNAVLGEGRLKTGNIVAIAVLGVLLAPCKIVYTPIVLLFLLVKPERFKDRRQCIAIKAAVCLLPILSIIATRAISLAQQINLVANEPMQQGDVIGHYYTMSDVLADPSHIAMLYLRSELFTLADILSQMIGGIPGWFQGNIAMRLDVIMAFYMVILLACFRTTDSPKLPMRIRMSLVAVSAATWLLVLTSMLFLWTFNTESIIGGLQGRYFLPVLALLVLGIQPARIKIGYNTAFWCPFCMGALNAVNIIFITAQIMY